MGPHRTQKMHAVYAAIKYTTIGYAVQQQTHYTIVSSSLAYPIVFSMTVPLAAKISFSPS